MKILLASSSSGSRGGGEIFLKYLGQGLAQRGHEIIFWCAQHPRMEELAGGLGASGRVVRSPYRNFYDYRTRILATSLNFSTSRRLATEWDQLRPDIVHVNKQNLEDGLDLLRAANLLARAPLSPLRSPLSIPALCTIHITQTANYLGARVAWLRDWLARRSLGQFKGPYVAVQETRRKELSAFLRNGHKTCAIHNGVPLVETGAKLLRQPKRLELGLDEEEILVIGVGRMEAQKRPMLFLEVAERLRRKLPQVKFLWVGGGSLARDWDQWVAARQLSKVISRAEWQSDVKPFLLAADFFLHVAAYEGLPFALIEAMSAGLPCAIPAELAAEIPTLGGDTVLLIDNEAGLVRALQSKTELLARGSRSRAVAMEHFSIEQMASRYETLYQELICP